MSAVTTAYFDFILLIFQNLTKDDPKFNCTYSECFYFLLLLFFFFTLFQTVSGNGVLILMYTLITRALQFLINLQDILYYRYCTAKEDFIFNKMYLKHLEHVFEYLHDLWHKEKCQMCDDVCIGVQCTCLPQGGSVVHAERLTSLTSLCNAYIRSSFFELPKPRRSFKSILMLKTLKK